MDQNTATATGTLAPVADIHQHRASDTVAPTAFGLENLMALRDALVALKGPLSNIPTLRTNVEERLFNQAAQDRILKQRPR